MTLQALTARALLDLRAAANPFGGVERDLDRLARSLATWSAFDDASRAPWRLEPPNGAHAAE